MSFRQIILASTLSVLVFLKVKDLTKSLTKRGLNTPNLGTGGYNCHGPYECACLEEMENVVHILIEIAKE